MEVRRVNQDLDAVNNNSEILNHQGNLSAEYHCRQYSSQPMYNFHGYDDKFPSEHGGLQETSPVETNLYALTSKLSCLGQKAQELEQFFQSQSLCANHDEQQQAAANSALYSIIGEVISTGASILSECQSLSFSHTQQQRDQDQDQDQEERTEIIEINEDDILAEHTHFCKICGKGFRRDGNVRIHMRSHGNQYKTQEALMSTRPKAKRSLYSCPFEECRRNRRHPNFKPLKSMACLRNHYKRSHCAKMYTCNRCGKEFSFVGDLKTHGNKCGHSTWKCSCATTFSTKDKLFRHVTLFQDGHKPVLPSQTTPAAAVGNGEKSIRNDKLPVQDANNLAECPPSLGGAPSSLAEVPSSLAESQPSYGSDEDLLLLGVGSNGIQQTEYFYDKMQVGQENELTFLSEDREESELYGSLFWSNGDLQWP